MNELNFLTGLGCFLFIAAIITVFWLIWKIGNRNAIKREYDMDYIFIDVCIVSFEVNELNRDYLLKMLDGLRELKYKDTARTIKLIDKFNEKYEPEASRIMKEYNKLKP